jgi:hypothetical protein
MNLVVLASLAAVVSTILLVVFWIATREGGK